jgi:hypothetical protein
MKPSFATIYFDCSNLLVIAYATSLKHIAILGNVIVAFSLVYECYYTSGVLISNNVLCKSGGDGQFIFDSSRLRRFLHSWLT